MMPAPTHRNVILFSTGLIVLLTLGRLARFGFDSSVFIAAGSAFVDARATPAPVHVSEGQGYDGQYFYRYALDPFDVSQKFGVLVDIPPYRMQRIAYPLLAWIFAFGGIPWLVPWAMILVNVFAFTGIVHLSSKLISHLGAADWYRWLPLALTGLYMSLARDLSEVVELYFFLLALYSLLRGQYALYALCATVTILARDTSMIAFIPLTGCMLWRMLKGKFNVIALVSLVIPFAAFAAWKMFLLSRMAGQPAMAGYQQLGFPLKGILDGFLYNADFSDAKHIVEWGFWTAHMVWQLWLCALVLRAAPWRSLLQMDDVAMLTVVFSAWIFFASTITLIIYLDDWGFVRIFSLMNMLGMLILAARGAKTGRTFNYASAGLVAATLLRLIVRI